MIHRNLGYHDGTKLSYNLEAILYDRKHHELQHYDMLDVEEPIVGTKMISNIVVLFTDSLNEMAPIIGYIF